MIRSQFALPAGDIDPDHQQDRHADDQVLPVRVDQHNVHDIGTAIAVAEAVAAGEGDRGVLLCGTGIGMSLAANKVKGAYAALISDVYSAQRAVLSNNANIACIGAFTVGEKLAVELLKTWLSAEFDPNCASAPKVARYKSYDEARGA